MHTSLRSAEGGAASRSYGLRMATLSAVLGGLLLYSLLGDSHLGDDSCSPASWVLRQIGIPLFVGIVGTYSSVRGIVQWFVCGFSTILLVSIAGHAILALVCSIILLTPA